MNPDPLSPEEKALAERLRHFRPAPASVAFRDRLRAQRTKTVVRPTVWAWVVRASFAAAAVVVGVLVFWPKPAQEMVTTIVPHAERPAEQRLLSISEVGLIRRGLEPPVQLLAVEDYRLADATNPSERRANVTTRIIPVVLEYH
jgi:hypothetical protein